MPAARRRESELVAHGLGNQFSRLARMASIWSMMAFMRRVVAW